MKRKLINALLIMVVFSQYIAYPVAAQISPSVEFPNEGWIVFLGKGNNIWLVHPDGSGLKQITTDASTKIVYGNLKWSPDGQYLAFSRWYWDGKNNINEIQVIGISNLSPARKITETEGNFDWLPDSRRIVFDKPVTYQVNARGCFTTILKYDGLYEIDINNGETRQYLAPINNKPILLPFVSPDKNHVIFRPNQDQTMYGSGPFFVTSLLNGSALPLTNSWSSCVWSKDGQSIACDTWGESCDIRNSAACPITLFNSSGAVISKLPILPDQYDLRPAWSPDNRSIAVVTTDGYSFRDGPCGGGSGPSDGVNTLDILSVGDSTRRRLTSGTFNDWSPDGKFIVLSRGERVTVGNQTSYQNLLYLVDFQTGELSRPIAEGILAKWQPGFRQEAIKNFRVVPQNTSDINTIPVLLAWTAPGNPFQAEPPASEFELRYSTEELSESTWKNAPVLKSYSVQSIPGSALEYKTLLPSNLLNRKLYIGVKSRQPAGNWSPLSNVVEYLDSGFRPGRDGFSFSNMDAQWGRYPSDLITFNDFTLEDMYQMFGNSICYFPVSNANQCIYFPWVSVWLIDANIQISDNGHCLGMATTSLITKLNPETLSLFSLQAMKLSDESINLSSIPTRKKITYYAATQLFLPLYFQLDNAIVNSTPAIFLESLKQGFLSNDPRIIVYSDTKFRHALTPIAIRTQKGQPARIYYYENNEIGEKQMKQMDVDPNEAKWPASSRYTAVPLSWVTGKLIMPWELSKVFSINAPGGSAVIENTKGQMIGTINGQFVNEIPGAVASPLINGSEVKIEPIYFLPLDDSYKLSLNVSPQTINAPVTISYLAPQSFARIEQANLNSQMQTEISFSPSENGVVFHASSDQKLNITYGVKQSAQVSPFSYTFSFQNVALNKDDTVSIQVEPSSDSLIVNYARASGGKYDLKIHRVNSNGEQSTTYSEISIDGKSTQLFDISAWDAATPLHVWVDRTSDGTFDEEKQFTAQGELITGWLGIPYSSWAGYGAILIGFILCVVGAVGVIKIRRRL